jgi:iron(II)-dependent oxidoreductase
VFAANGRIFQKGSPRGEQQNMQRALNISVLGITGAAGCTGLVMGIARADALLCVGSAIGLIYVALRVAPRQLLPVTGQAAPRSSGRAKTVSRVAAPAKNTNRPLDDGSESGDLVARMLAEGRYALLARSQIAQDLSDAQYEKAVEALHESMSIVPAGPVCMEHSFDDESGAEQPPPAQIVEIEAVYLDRYCVTNRAYRRFVLAGGYEEMGLWDPEIWPGVLEFVDRAGCPGPRFWCDGAYAAGEDDHPVVGVSWFEAQAYARWVGKRLPTDAEWVKAASWPVVAGADVPVQRKYPWGDLMDRARANLFTPRGNRTLPVTALPDGASVGGVYQMCGNVWEWTTGDYGSWLPQSCKIELPTPMKAIRGGAFDTYFENHASCQFQSGDSPLARKPNIGFRCALSLCDVAEREVMAGSAHEAEPGSLDDAICGERPI